MKRVKVGLQAVRSGRPNKLHEFKKGVEQANRLAQLVGFAYVYLWVFVLVDTREQNGGCLTYDGMTSELDSAVRAAISTAKLDSRVGLVRFDFVQPIDRPPLTVGTHSAHLGRLARYAPQPRELTSWLRGLR